MEEAIDRLDATPIDRVVAQGAEVLEEAAAALACMTALYTTPGDTLDQRWQQQINDLVAAAASLEQLADFAATAPPTPRRPARGETIMPNPTPFGYRDATGAGTRCWCARHRTAPGRCSTSP